jgi:hypothetical protein
MPWSSLSFFKTTSTLAFMTPFDQSINVNALKLKLYKGISGVICCLIYTGLQHDKASFHNGRSISATAILLQMIFLCTGKGKLHQIWLDHLLDITWSSHWIIGALWLRVSDKQNMSVLCKNWMSILCRILFV